MLNQETAQALVNYYQSQLELTPQYLCLKHAKKKLAEIQDCTIFKYYVEEKEEELHPQF